MTQLHESTPHRPTLPRARRTSRRLGITLLKVAVLLFVSEFAVMCALPLLGLEGVWENATDSLLLTIIAMPALYVLGFSPRGLIATNPRRRTRLERRMVVLLVANVVMVLLVIVAYGLIVSGQKSAARVINVAGRQRMLSQRLVEAAMFEAMDLAHADLTEKEPITSGTLAECTAQFEQALRGLVEGDAELGLVPCPSPEAERQMESVGPVWHQLRALLQRTSEPADMEEAHAYYIALQRAGDRVLVEMNKAVGMLEKHYEGQAELLSTVLGPMIVLAAVICFLLMVTVHQVTRHRQKLEAELLQTNEGLHAVNQVHQALFYALTTSDVVQSLADALVHEFKAYFARVWLIKPGDLCSRCAHSKQCSAKERCLHLVASSGRYTHIDGDHRRVPLGAFKIGLIAQGCGKTISNDVVNDERVHHREWAAKHGLRSFAGFPLVRKGEVIGVMAMFSKHRLPRHVLNTLDLLAQLGTSALTSVEKAEALRASEAKARKLSVAVEQSPASVVVTDTKGTIEYVNPMFTEVTGYTAEEAIGQNPRILKSGIWPKSEYKKLWDRLLAGEVWTGEFQNKKKNGEMYWETASISPVRDAKGEITHFLAVKQDITERKRAETALRESEERFKCISTSAQDAIIMMDSDGNISYWNKAAERIFGYTQEEVIGKCLHSQAFIVPERFREAHFRAWPEFRETGQGAVTGKTVVISGIRKNGEEFPVELSLSAVRMKGRWHSISVLRDITARKRAEADRQKRAEIEQERNHLRDAVKAQERLLGVVGHELRTPLAGVRAIAELLIDEGSRDMAEFDTFLRNIHDEVVRMSGLVNDLLEVARMHSGVAQWNWTEVSLRDAGEAAMSAVRPLIDHDRVKLILDVQPGDLAMRGDEDAIRRLVLNLVNNACKNTAEGSVCVTVRALEKCGLGHVEIEVRDTGAGMTADVARRLGQAFALNSGVVGDSHVKGSGLGLAICRGIVAAHGGSISVNTVQGAGSVFSVLLRSDLAEPMTAEKETDILCEVS